MISIIDAMSDPAIFGHAFKDLSSWRSWQTYLRALFKIDLDKKERSLFKKCTGLSSPPKERIRETLALCGRRSGKSTIAALIATYLACFGDWEKYLSRGEKGWIFILSVDKLQSRIVGNYIKGFFQGSKYLRGLIARETAEELELKNGAIIARKTSSWRSSRGYTLIACILEELCFWRSEESAAPDKEIVAAVKPGLSTIPESLLIGISSVHSRSGYSYESWKKYWGQSGGPVIWWSDTVTMNSTIDQKIIKESIAEDPEIGRAEWESQWRQDLSQLLPVELLEAAVVSGRGDLPPMPALAYRAFSDPAGGSGQDSFCLAVGHRDESGKIIIDCVRERKPRFSPEEVVKEFSAILAQYGLYRVTMDKWAGGFPKEAFSRYGITTEYSDLSASELYLSFLPLLSSGQIELPDNKRLISQLGGLERRSRPGGQRDSVSHHPSLHDDLGNSVSGVAVMLALKPQRERRIIWLNDPEETQSWEDVIKSNPHFLASIPDSILAMNKPDLVIEVAALLRADYILPDVARKLNIRLETLQEWRRGCERWIREKEVELADEIGTRSGKYLEEKYIGEQHAEKKR